MVRRRVASADKPLGSWCRRLPPRPRRWRKCRSARDSCPRLFRPAQGLQVDSQLLAFFVEMAAFEAQSASDVGHMKIVTANLGEQDFFFERFGACGECDGGGGRKRRIVLGR